MSLQWQHTRLMVIGDAMIDRYIWGKTERISPEAPVPVLNWLQDENRLGGAANVALNARALGLDVALCAMSGTDENAELLQTLCAHDQIDGSYLYRSKQRPTSVKTRILSGQQHLLRVDREDTRLIEAEDIREIMPLWQKALEEFTPQVVILQDYNKGLLHPKLIEWVIQKCQEENIFVAVDPKKEFIQHYTGVDLFKPNLKELSQFLNREVSPSMESLTQAASDLRKELSFKNLIVTLSEHGIFYQNDQGDCGIAPTRPRPIVDVCGAGDAVITIAAVALHNGFPIDQTARLCNIAGGQVCGSVGVSTLTLETIEKEWSDSQTKIS